MNKTNKIDKMFKMCYNTLEEIEDTFNKKRR